MTALFLAALAVLAAGALAAPLSGSHAPRVGAGAAVAGGALGLGAAAGVLCGLPAAPLNVSWNVPYGSFSLGIDALSAVFLVPVFLLPAVAAVYGTGYMRHARHSPGAHWFFYDLLVAGMAMVAAARNGILFLVAWEIMSLASFFLVATDDTDEHVRRAGWTYLVATHLGTAFLVAMFMLLSRGSGSMDFDRLAVPASGAAAVFLCAVAGFGTKAGFMPLHVWLPEAHPAAPSHVSAVMSGVMVKTGLYGLLRMLTLLPAPPAWWGGLLLAVGAGAVPAVLLALAQRDLKRLLAYSSVENVAVAALGVGTGLLGRATGHPAVAALGFAAALLHIVNHSLFKGTLFLAAGSVLHATGTREIERLGGLLKTMPATGAAFLVGAVAASGLPPLNGFPAELLLYVAAYRGAASGSPAALATIVALVLVGGIASAAFAKAFGTAFLGAGRTPCVQDARDPAPAMRLSTTVLAVLCIASGLLAPALLPLLAPAVSVLLPEGGPGGTDSVQAAAGTLASVTLASLVLAVAAGALALLRAKLLEGREVREAVIWDCGYAAPTARMQYTGTSFARPLTMLFRAILPMRGRSRRPTGLFPSPSSVATEPSDLARERLFQPLFERFSLAVAPVRRLQGGRVQVYVLYVAATLVALLVFRLGAP